MNGLLYVERSLTWGSSLCWLLSMCVIVCLSFCSVASRNRMFQKLAEEDSCPNDLRCPSARSVVLLQLGDPRPLGATRGGRGATRAVRLHHGSANHPAQSGVQLTQRCSLPSEHNSPKGMSINSILYIYIIDSRHVKAISESQSRTFCCLPRHSEKHDSESIIWIRLEVTKN